MVWLAKQIVAFCVISAFTLAAIMFVVGFTSGMSG